MTLDLQTTELSAGSYQKSVCQPTIQKKYDSLNDGNPHEVVEKLVSKRTRWRATTPREFPVVDVGHGLKGKVCCSVYRHKREHKESVGDKAPLDSLIFSVGGIEQCDHTLEEQDNDDPCNE